MEGWTKLQRQFLRSLVALATVALSSIALASQSARFESFASSDIWLPLLLAGIQICSTYALHWVGAFITDTRTEKLGLIIPLTISPVLALLPISNLAFEEQTCEQEPTLHAAIIIHRQHSPSPQSPSQT